jgi:hypothetical protein
LEKCQRALSKTFSFDLGLDWAFPTISASEQNRTSRISRDTLTNPNQPVAFCKTL